MELSWHPASQVSPEREDRSQDAKLDLGTMQAAVGLRQRLQTKEVDLVASTVVRPDAHIWDRWMKEDV